MMQNVPGQNHAILGVMLMPS